MAFKRPKRGISLGTILMLSLCLVTLLVGGGIFTRISGSMDGITLDPGLLTEPLSILSRSVGDAGDGGGADSSTAPVTAATDAPTQAPTAAPTPAPTAPPSYRLSLTAAGQISMGTELRQGTQTGAGQYDVAAVFAPLGQALSGADLSIATLRTGLTDDEGSLGNYTAPAALASGLQGVGINLVNLGTDRLFDSGLQGVQATRDILGRLGLAATGAYTNDAERQTLPMQSINGINVGILSYTGNASNAGSSAASASEMAGASRQLSADAAAADIGALRAQGADIILVLANWGNRGDTKATREMRDLADAMVSAGADIVLGVGPTSVLEMERRTVAVADGAPREAFIAYSLGNFLVDDSRDTSAITGVVLHLDLTWDAQTQRAAIADSWYLPTWIMRWRDASGVNRYQLVPAGASSAPENMTSGVYGNMKSAYQSLVNKLGTGAATPKTEP